MRTLEDIVKQRDEYELGSKEWTDLNEEKARLMENKKPSTKEVIITFDESDLENIPEGFVKTNSIPNVPFSKERRALLEYHPEKRHPIPYCLIRFENKYFFILREGGSGEARLIGKKGLVGGHIKAPKDNKQLEEIIMGSLIQELSEEANKAVDNIKKIRLLGLIKSNEGVDADHLGLIYEIEVTTDDIETTEDGIISGIWIDKKDIVNHYEQLESWSRIVFDNIIKE